MIRKFLRDRGYLHFDEVKTLLSKSYETGALTGYSQLLAQLVSKDSALSALNELSEKKERRLH